MKSNDKSQEEMIKNIAILGTVSIFMLLLIVFSIQFLKNKIVEGDINQEEIVGDKETSKDFESASTEMGKTIEEAENDLKKNEEQDIVRNEEKKEEKTATQISKKEKMSDNKQELEESKTSTEKEPENEEITFQAPIKGEIIREFAADSLVYSNTLQEWITHKGVDIKADKTSVVASACDGTVEAIKTDPRYGLTVIINHKNGYKTVYSNLLTAEFVKQGENVKAGQTIGTVGNSAAFEIADSYHLHFELLKDGEYQNPTVYIEF